MATVATQQPVLPSGPPGQPDIAYLPDHAKYLERAKRRQETETLAKTLPPGFPSQLESTLVWDGNNLAETYDWNYRLTEDDLAEIDAALQHFKSMSCYIAQNAEIQQKQARLTNGNRSEEAAWLH